MKERGRDRERDRERRATGKTESVSRANIAVLWKTGVLLFVFGVAAFVALGWKLYTIQILQHDVYQEKAIGQQTMDNAVSANRGRITDASGKVLAMSATVYDVIISPNDFKKVQKSWDDRNAKNPGQMEYSRPEARYRRQPRLLRKRGNGMVLYLLS